MKTLVDFSKKHILIIGGDAEIGSTTAVTLSRLGAAVELAGRDIAELEKTLALLDGKDHHILPLNTARPESLGEAISTAVLQWGGYDGLVYAAERDRSVPMEEESLSQIADLFQINFFSFLEAVRQIAVEGRYRSGMRIVGVSSIAALKGDPNRVAYSASKAALEGAVRSLGVELGQKGICINTVIPGLLEGWEGIVRESKLEEDFLVEQLMLKRQCRGLGKPQDIANAIAFLLSPAAKMITGCALPVDGGFITGS